MIDLKKLIDLLPFYFKERDTYKVNGKGILERYLELLGTYLDEKVTPDIDKILEITEINEIPYYYINFFWEFLGELPLFNTNFIFPEKWNQNHHSFDTPEDIENKRALWDVVKSDALTIPEDKVRKILKYSVSLLKIRGSKAFFEVLFRFYGISCDMVMVDDNARYSKIPEFDITQLDQLDTDENIQCKDDHYIDIYLKEGDEVFRDENSVPFYGSDGFKYNGITYTIPDIFEMIKAYNCTDGYTYVDENTRSILVDDVPTTVDIRPFKALLKFIIRLFNKYLPANVKFRDIFINNTLLDNDINLHVSYQGTELTTNQVVVIPSNRTDVSLDFHISTREPEDVPEVIYKVVDSGTGKFSSLENTTLDFTRNFNTPGNYHFRLFRAEPVLDIAPLMAKAAPSFDRPADKDLLDSFGPETESEYGYYQLKIWKEKLYENYIWGSEAYHPDQQSLKIIPGITVKPDSEKIRSVTKDERGNVTVLLNKIGAKVKVSVQAIKIKSRFLQKNTFSIPEEDMEYKAQYGSPEIIPLQEQVLSGNNPIVHTTDVYGNVKCNLELGEGVYRFHIPGTIESKLITVSTYKSTDEVIDAELFDATKEHFYYYTGASNAEQINSLPSGVFSKLAPTDGTTTEVEIDATRTVEVHSIYVIVPYMVNVEVYNDFGRKQLLNQTRHGNWCIYQINSSNIPLNYLYKAKLTYPTN